MPQWRPDRASETAEDASRDAPTDASRNASEASKDASKDASEVASKHTGEGGTVGRREHRWGIAGAQRDEHNQVFSMETNHMQLTRDDSDGPRA